MGYEGPVQRRVYDEAAEKEIGARRVDLDTLLAESDFISVHTDLNDSTRGMFNTATFKKMKPTAVFVNTVRGPLVVEADLAAALRDGIIFAAGLDVTDPEPPRVDNPLLKLPNCIVARILPAPPFRAATPWPKSRPTTSSPG